jgi:carboxymethylenebutenolidase
MNSQIKEITRQYLDGHLDRRRFLGKLTAILGSYTIAHHYLEVSGLAAGPVASLESARANVSSSEVHYPSADLSITASLSVPSTSDPAPGVIVIHENRGLNDHTRDVARRFAAAGYLALAPDILSRKGGTAATDSPDHARELIGEIAPEEAIQDLLAGHEYLKKRPELKGQKVGSVGFCWGGARSFLLAAADPELAACVVFYGSTPAEEKLNSIVCPVLGLYGELDTRITSRVEATAEAMGARNKSFEYKIYAGADHAFFNDTRAERYRQEAARDAWQRVLAFFEKHLKG